MTTTEHRGAGPRYVRPPATARRLARRVTRDGRVFYAVGPRPGRYVAGLVTLATVVAALVVLSLTGRADMASECRNVMFGSDDAASVQTCRAAFGPRGY